MEKNKENINMWLFDLEKIEELTKRYSDNDTIISLINKLIEKSINNEYNSFVTGNTTMLGIIKNFGTKEEIEEEQVLLKLKLDEFLKKY